MTGLLEESHRRVQTLLHEKEALLRRLAGALLEKEVLEGEELAAFAREAKPGD